MRKTILISAILTAIVASGEEEPARDFGFRPLEIYKFEPGTSRLIVEDLNGDGRDDVLFANNHISRLEILLRKPDSGPLEELPELEECFDDVGMIVDQRLKALRVGDLDGDGRKDIVTFGTLVGLQVRYQQPDQTFGQPERIFVKEPESVTTLQLQDLNGDDRADILLCRKDEADILWNDGSHSFPDHKTLTFSSDKSYYGDTADINGDGITDLIFHFNDQRNPLKIRFGRKNGLFGIEQPLDLPPRQYMDLMPGAEAPQAGMVLRNRLAFRLYDFAQEPQPPFLEARELSPGRIGLEGTSKKASPAWISDDFNQDGFGDLIIAAPELSRLHLYYGGTNGLNPEPVRIDTLSDVVRISKAENGDLIVVSKKEKIAARHAGHDLEQFPAILQTPGEVLAGAAVAGTDECWFVCKNDDRELNLVQMKDAGADATLHPLDLQNEPEDLLAFRLPDNQIGIILFMPYDTPKMILYNQGSIEALSSDSFRALSQRLIRSHIHAETPGDGSTLIVAQGSVARRFEWKNGRYEVVRQFNPENPRGELIASCSYTLTDGSNGLLIYDRSAGDLIRFAEKDGEWAKIHVPDADQTIFNLAQLANPERDIFILLDRTGINQLQGGGERLETVPAGEYVSLAEDPLLAYAKAVRLGKPMRPMVALVDPANKSIELVSRDGEELKNELTFQVFLTSDFAQMGRNSGSEPHDVESGDLNGDGIGDLVVLSHDKLLIYPGE